MRYHVILEKQETGYTAYVPELPGCVSQGENKKETLTNINEALSLYIAELGAYGRNEKRHRRPGAGDKRA
ncbi:type II toxin-antitoxin system HicB family antitoxin [Candidatus Micrarchaeota archaeon]|nr:type II toxin-antitoxin system HicB family antitoxin [Candidatus Micrarchaeota archaeon]